MSRNIAGVGYYLAAAAAAMVSVSGVVSVAPPPEPVMLRLDDPIFAVEAAVRVRVLDLAPVPSTVVGENAAVTPDGSPVVASVREELKAAAAEAVSVTLTFPPGFNVSDVFDKESWNGGEMVTRRVCCCVIPCPVAVMVSV